MNEHLDELSERLNYIQESIENVYDHLSEKQMEILDKVFNKTIITLKEFEKAVNSIKN